MKIWIDIRNLSNQEYDFCNKFLKDFLNKNDMNHINIYSKVFFDYQNIKIDSWTWFFSEQILFLKTVYNDKNDLIITFNDNFPILYKRDFIQVVTSIERLLYPSIENSKTFNKHLYLNILKSNLNNSKKILCFDEKTKKDLNEKLNISEDKIEIILPFFHKNISIKSEIDLQIDVKQRHCINWNYIIYDSWLWNNKNIKRLLDAIKNIDISLVILWNNITNDIESREMVMRFWLKDKVVFVWLPDEKELKYYYTQSVWVIFPLLYSSFPFSLNNLLNFWTKLISSDINEIKEIFWDKAEYFSPISTFEIQEKLNKIIENEKYDINYDDIFNKYNVDSFNNNLIKLCLI